MKWLPAFVARACLVAFASACSASAEAPKEPPSSLSLVEPSREGAAVSEQTSVEELPAPNLELTFVGDVIFGRYREHGYDPIPEKDFDVFGPMRTAMASDLLIGNLETPLAEVLPRHSPLRARFAFGASREHAALLVDAGFDAMSLANNHWYDLREKGVERTPEILRELEIVPLGSAAPDGERFRVETMMRNGWRIGVVSITARSNVPVPDEGLGPPYLATRRIGPVVGPLLRAARAEHDLLLALVHWGDEYEDSPGRDQVAAGRALVDAGADLVIGHHPHVLQGVERYGHGVIAYSLGNFLFEHAGAKPRQTGVLRVRMQHDPHCIEAVTFHPAYITTKPLRHPVPATGAMGKQVRGRMARLSEGLGTRWSRVDEDLVLETKSCAPLP